MSWFTYASLEKKKDKIGVWLRVRSNADLISFLRKRAKLKYNHHIWKIKIVEYDKKEGKVGLEVWCRILTLNKIIKGIFIFFKNNVDIDEPEKNLVFFMWVKENPDWICEGDLGKGFPKRLENN